MKTLLDRPLTLTVLLTGLSVVGSILLTVTIMAVAGAEDRLLGLTLAAALPAVLAPGPIFVMAHANRRMRALRDAMERLANTDPLTGLANRRAFFSRAPALITDPALPVAVLMVDIDRFKWVNDTHGHAAGDRAIAAVGQAIVEAIPVDYRQTAVVARFGGEEFAVVLPCPVASVGILVAERICRGVRRSAIARDGQPIAVTVSVGIAVLIPPADLDGALRAADEAVYLAKRAGRDCWVEYKPGDTRPPDDRDDSVAAA